MVVQGHFHLVLGYTLKRREDRVLHLILGGHLDNMSGIASKLSRDEFENLLLASEVFGLFMSARVL